MKCASCGTENPGSAKFCNECGINLTVIPVREERKVVTIVFCDLVGFTRRSESLDPEDVRAFLLPYYELMQAEVTRYGGVIDKLYGDGAMAVFGAPVAHEDDPERAIRASLRVLERLPSLGLDLKARIGINTGEVVVAVDHAARGDALTGDTVNTASRLQSAAPVGAVVVGESTHSATARVFDYQVLSPVELKGKAGPVAMFRPLAPIAVSGREFAPDSTPLVGRDEELALVIETFESARNDADLRFLTILGEPGLGKSRLVREFSRYVDDLPELVTWRQGRCLPYGEGISFWALSEIVKAEAGILDTDDQRTLLSKLDAAVAEPDASTKTWIVDRLGPLVGLETSTAAPEQTEVFTAWRRFLESLAIEGPTVLVVEDLHWADPGFLAFLEHLAERTVGVPLLVVVTARPEVEERHPTWPPGRRSTVLPLSPLGDADIEVLVRSSMPEVSDELTRVVLGRAGGSPLYAEQLAAMLHEQAVPIAGSAIDGAMIPESVHALIAARVDALPPEPKRVLMEASVMGKTFWAGAIAALGEHPGLEAALGLLVRREFCRPRHPSTIEGDAEFGFWHTLVRDVCYSELTKVERARLHADVATWIHERTHEAMGGEAEILVYHLDAALGLAPSASGLDTVALTDLLTDALLASGEAAMRTDIPRAIPQLERVVSLIPPEDDRGLKAMRRLAESLAATGSTGSARSLYEELLYRCLRRNEIKEAVRLAWDLVDVYQSAGEFDAISSMIAGLRDRVDPAPSLALVGLLVLEADEFNRAYRTADALACAQAAIATAKGLGIAPPTEALGHSAFARAVFGDPEGLSDARFVADAYLREGRARDALDTLNNIAMCAKRWKPGDAIGFIEQAIELASEIGAEADLWTLRAGRIWIYASLGRFDVVVAEADPIIAWAVAANDALTRLFALQGLAEVDRHRGGSRVDAAELADLARSVFGPGYVGSAAPLAHARGDDDLARALLRESAENDPEPQDRLVPVCIEVGLMGIAEELLGREVSGRPDAEAERAMAEGALAGSRGDWSRAVERYRQAVDAWTSLEQPIELAQGLQELGYALLHRRESDEAVAKLRESRRLWVGMGATLRIAEVDELLATV